MKRLKKLLIWALVIVAVLGVTQICFYWHATTSPQWEYANRALECPGANYDLRYCIDLPTSERRDYTNSSWKPMPCINTASSLYNDKHRAANCNKFMADPSKWGFQEVSADEAVPGDMMLFIRRTDGARHAGVYTMNSILGPLCANTGPSGIFFKYMPIKPLLAVELFGFYKAKYYRYNTYSGV